ncbi:MAG: hypothetical protein H6936_15585 [Burkholderiales bacterium]|nr:hypothetical protein [Nitrosomonas sp.]MCP5276233.1 hypothetical protein [Burkholderiales bacterium]
MSVRKRSTRPNALNQPDGQDAAWAILHTPLSTEELKLFCQDIERLFRINPLLNFRKWQQIGPDRYYFSGQNISQKPPFDFELIFTVKQLPEGIQIEYEQGLKNRTTFIIEPFNHQSKLTITDFYDGLPETERKLQLHQVDKSITAWANDLQRYLTGWKKWSRYRLWRCYMHHVWQPMKPMGRRITAILFWVAFFELLLILLGAGVYYLEYTE